MSKVTSFVPFASEPEPEPKTWEEQTAAYRRNYRAALEQTATVLALPLHKVTAMFKKKVANI